MTRGFSVDYVYGDELQDQFGYLPKWFSYDGWYVLPPAGINPSGPFVEESEAWVDAINFFVLH